METASEATSSGAPKEVSSGKVLLPQQTSQWACVVQEQLVILIWMTPAINVLISIMMIFYNIKCAPQTQTNAAKSSSNLTAKMIQMRSDKSEALTKVKFATTESLRTVMLQHLWCSQEGAGRLLWTILILLIMNLKGWMCMGGRMQPTQPQATTFACLR